MNRIARVTLTPIVLLATIATVTPLISNAEEALPDARPTVYEEGLIGRWRDWSWDSSVYLWDSRYSHSGDYSVSCAYLQPYGGLYFAYSPGHFNTAGYDNLVFYINGGTASGQLMTINLVDTSGDFLPSVYLNPYIDGGSVASDTWRQVVVPLNVLISAPTRIDGIVIRDALGAAQPRFYIDDMAFANDIPTPVATDTPTETWTPDNTSTPIATDTPTETWTPSDTPTETWTPTDTPTETWTPSYTPTETWTPSDTPTPAGTPTDVPTYVYTPTGTNTDTPTPESTTNTPTTPPSDTRTPTNTPTRTPTNTPTRTYTPAGTNTSTATPGPSGSCTLYASPSGSGSNCISSSPCSLDTANDRAQAGDTVCLFAGTYERSSTLYLRSGSASGGYVTYTGGINGEAIIRQANQGDIVMVQNGQYVIIQNLTVDGAGSNYYKGIGTQNSHHVIVRDTYVHDAGEAGVYALSSDYITFDHNLIFHNGYDGYGWSSGIGMNRDMHFDSAPGFHFFFTNNIIAGQYDSSLYHTDGNGIIIDGGYSSSNVTSPALIANNVIYSNGGRCIIVYEQTGNHWVVNNTCYKNALDLQVGGCGFSRGCSEEFFVQESRNNYFVNNIARSWDTQHPFGGCCNSSGNQLNHNLAWGTGSSRLSWYNVTSLLHANPRFVNPPTVSDLIPIVPGEGWFHDALDPRQLGNRLELQSGSPAINAGIDPTTLTSDPDIRVGLQQYVYQDINEVDRPQEGTFDLGAYEYIGP